MLGPPLLSARRAAWMANHAKPVRLVNDALTLYAYDHHDRLPLHLGNAEETHRLIDKYMTEKPKNVSEVAFHAGLSGHSYPWGSRGDEIPLCWIAGDGSAYVSFASGRQFWIGEEELERFLAVPVPSE